MAEPRSQYGHNAGMASRPVRRAPPPRPWRRRAAAASAGPRPVERVFATPQSVRPDDRTLRLQQLPSELATRSLGATFRERDPLRVPREAVRRIWRTPRARLRDRRRGREHSSAHGLLARRTAPKAADAGAWRFPAPCWCDSAPAAPRTMPGRGQAAAVARADAPTTPRSRQRR